MDFPLLSCLYSGGFSDIKFKGRRRSGQTGWGIAAKTLKYNVIGGGGEGKFVV